MNLVLPIGSLFFGWFIERRRRAAARRDDKFYHGDLYKVPESADIAKQRRLIERDINENTLRLLVSWSSAAVICILVVVVYLGP